jgi:glycosyltransferase involved in cell wall biosynthesis
MFPLDLDYSAVSLSGSLRRVFFDRFLKSYDMFLSISQYTQKWVDQYWNVNSYVLYPPVKTPKSTGNLPKDNLIMNVGRFFAGGHNKKQDVMIKTFIEMYDKGWAREWKLILVGRKHTDEASRKYIQSLEEMTRGYPVELRYDTSSEELQTLLNRTKVYWHATGYEEAATRNPEKFEHFGLSTIEAAQFGAVPVVFNGGGQPEIIKHAQNGFLWDTADQLMEYTRLLMENDHIWNDVSKTAVDSMKIFDVETQLRWFSLFLSAYYKFEQ